MPGFFPKLPRDIKTLQPVDNNGNPLDENTKLGDIPEELWFEALKFIRYRNKPTTPPGTKDAFFGDEEKRNKNSGRFEKSAKPTDKENINPEETNGGAYTPGVA